MGARRGFTAGSAALLAVLAAGALGQASGSYTLPWSGIGYSGGVQTVGGYELTAAVGQPLAGTPLGGPGGYELDGGFLTVDTVGPVIQATRTPLPNGAGWNNTDVTVSFTATDASGAPASVTGPVTLTAEGAGQSVTGTAVDQEGNTAATVVTGINIDKTPPVITVTAPVDGAVLPQHQPATAAYTCADTAGGAISGATQCSGSAASGSPLDTSSLGPHTFTVTTADAAGNTASQTASYSVVACSPLTWKAPLSGSAVSDLPVGQTSTIRFSWGDCQHFIHDESVVVEVGDAANPQFPVTTWVYGFDITIDDTAQEYRVDFNPGSYGLAAGSDLTVRVYMQDGFAGHAQLHLVP